jgi:sugar transferase (PEP-CTERM/EpsH1 system associated)
MREVLGQQKARIDVVRNGVDSMYFDPRIEDSSPYSDGAQIVVFTGAMDYFANEDAVVWFARNVWPQIMENEGNVRFHIVGHKPTAAVRALDQCPGITVEGGVPDIRPYLKHASVAVAPLRLARGVQNKVLEALAMNLPVVAAPQALQGLDGELPKTVRVAATEGEFITQVLDVIRNSKRISGNFGRRFILENYDWDTNLSVFECILEETASTKREGETHARRAKPLNHRGG